MDLIKTIVIHKARRLRQGDEASGEVMRSILTKDLQTDLGLLIHRGWARVLVDRSYKIIDRRNGNGANGTELDSEWMYSKKWEDSDALVYAENPLAARMHFQRIQHSHICYFKLFLITTSSNNNLLSF